VILLRPASAKGAITFNFYIMKKLILSLVFLGTLTIAEASGCFQAVRRCNGEWTAYTCIPDQTSSACSSFYCKSCDGIGT